MKKLLGFLVVLAILVGAFYTWTQSHESKKQAPIVELHRVASASFFETNHSKLLTALIIGSDVREGDPVGGRSDSLHLLVIDRKTGAGTMVGFPRDSWVNIPGHGVSKINNSLIWGGPSLVVRTITSITHIPIQYWALIDFSRFRRLVDALGGVNVDVPYDMHDRYSGADFNKGRTHMNGAQALAFARNRHAARNGDFGRSANQGRLLLGALSKFKRDSTNVLMLAKYFEAFTKVVRSNVSTRELFALARLGEHMNPSRIDNVVVPGSTGTAGGGASVVFPNPGNLFDRIRNDGKL